MLGWISMSISDAGARPRQLAGVADGKFAKRFVIVSGLVPGFLLLWDAFRHNLGVNQVNFAIRTTGLLGLVFLTLSLAVTPLRRLTGLNVLISPRRNLGVLGFGYIVAHFIIFFTFDRSGSISSTLEEIVKRVYLWFGMGALLLMVPLAATSTDRMVARLGAKRWKTLHRLVYFVAISGLVHYYLLVKADTAQPIAFALVVGALLAFRIGRHYLDLRAEVRTAKAKLVEARATQPKRRKFWSGDLEIARIFHETHDVKTFRLVSPDSGPLPFTHVAGQYLTVKMMIDGRRVNRTYTIASSPSRSAYCEISVKRVVNGYGSAHLHETWREGQLIKVAAPAGKFCFSADEAERIVLIAGGIGITPMMSIVRHLTDRCWHGQIYLLFSARLVRDLVFRDELTVLQARFPNLFVHLTITGDRDTPWDGPRGNITRAAIEGFVPNLKRGPIMLCGPDPMMKAMRDHLIAMGVRDAEIHQEAFISPPRTADDASIPEEAESADFLSREGRTVRFARAGKVVILASGMKVLEAAEEADVRIPYECRAGICGQCKTRLLSGRVIMETQDALTSTEGKAGLFLACQARAVDDIVVDA
jgi:ferredoxin-NADP reductase/DMSO/TMAO reductase YedYZ heme-binding membrane subunit